MEKSTKVASKPVLVCTSHKGVFFGYVEADQPLDVPIIRIENARMVVSWAADVRGVLGLALALNF